MYCISCFLPVLESDRPNPATTEEEIKYIPEQV